MKKNTVNYTTGAKIRSILILILMAAALGIWGAYGWQQLHKAPAVEEWAIPMANQHITWSGAGYDGIYGRKAE